MFWWLEIVRGRPTRHLKAEKSLLMMRKFWSTLGQQMLPKFSLLAKIHEIYHKKYVQNFSNTVLGYKKGSKPKYFSRFKKYNFSAFKRTFNRPSMCLRSQDKSCCLAASVSKNVTFEENRPFFTTKNRFFQFSLYCHEVFTIRFGPAQGCCFDPKTESAHQATFLRKSNFWHKNDVFSANPL